MRIPAARPLTSQRVTLAAGGRRLAAATLGVRTRRLAAPFRRWRTLTFHVVEIRSLHPWAPRSR